MTFYTYLWLRDDGSPYYVGKGRGERAFRRGAPPPERIIVQDWPSEELAFEGEKLLIAYYGRIDLGTGCLRNLSDGGDGPAGAVRSKEFRMHLRAVNLGNTYRRGRSGQHMSEQARKNIAAGHVGLKHSEETCRKIGLGQIGNKRGPETRAKLSELARRRRRTA